MRGLSGDRIKRMDGTAAAPHVRRRRLILARYSELIGGPSLKQILCSPRPTSARTIFQGAGISTCCGRCVGVTGRRSAQALISGIMIFTPSPAAKRRRAATHYGPRRRQADRDRRRPVRRDKTS